VIQAQAFVGTVVVIGCLLHAARSAALDVFREVVRGIV
jgi:hypothetical protein